MHHSNFLTVCLYLQISCFWPQFSSVKFSRSQYLYLNVEHQGKHDEVEWHWHCWTVISHDLTRRETDWESLAGEAERHPPAPAAPCSVHFLALMLGHDKQLAGDLPVGRWETTVIRL